MSDNELNITMAEFKQKFEQDGMIKCDPPHLY